MYNSNFRSETSKADNGEEKERKYRTILHCDANSFFASCETALHPEYALVPMAVCGSVEDRHGIVLAKNELARKFGIKTAETVWSAKQKCKELVIVRPTYGLYDEMSKKMNDIFYNYTDLVEPFGVDESWLDVTGSLKLFGSGKRIADDIRKRIKNELGITVSVGVSFNKVFAKLGSDMKKPDATSVIPPENFASLIWHLPVSDLLFVGPSCAKTLATVGVVTIGDLACCDSAVLQKYIGKNGLMLKNFALGLDYADVTPFGYEPEPKSVSNGMTFRYNLATPEDVSFAVTYLSMSVAERLRKHNLGCNSIAVSVRDPNQNSFDRSQKLPHTTCLYSEISKNALSLIKRNFDPKEEIYSVTVRAEKLSRLNECTLQQKLFPEPWEANYEKRHSLEITLDKIRSRYGNRSIGLASAINNRLI
jgi:DNA polymerase-4